MQQLTIEDKSVIFKTCNIKSCTSYFNERCTIWCNSQLEKMQKQF